MYYSMVFLELRFFTAWWYYNVILIPLVKWRNGVENLSKIKYLCLYMFSAFQGTLYNNYITLSV